MSGIYWFFFILDTPRFYDTVNLKKMLLLQSENVVKNNYNNIHGVQIKFEVMPCKGQWKLEGRDWQFFFKCTSNEKHPCDYTQVMLVSSSSSSSSSSFDCCSGDHSFTTLGPVWGHGCYLSHLRVPLFCTVHHLHALHRTLRHQRWSMYSRYKHLKNLTLQLSCTGKDILRIYEYHPLHLHGLPLQDHCDISESSVQVFRFISSRMLTK